MLPRTTDTSGVKYRNCCIRLRNAWLCGVCMPDRDPRVTGQLHIKNTWWSDADVNTESYCNLPSYNGSCYVDDVTHPPYNPTAIFGVNRRLEYLWGEGIDIIKSQSAVMLYISTHWWPLVLLKYLVGTIYASSFTAYLALGVGGGAGAYPSCVREKAG